MTEPKEEKCEACCGSGYINFWTDDGHISMRTCRRCDGYGYIKAKPMTNEEHLKSCTTEQLAEEIVNLTLLDKYKLYDQMESAEYEHGIGVGAKKVIVEWLKQPHTPKE